MTQAIVVQMESILVVGEQGAKPFPQATNKPQNILVRPRTTTSSGAPD
jgi:hypothetical protein